MPTTSIDTFFACTIMVAVVLIATAFIGSSMVTRIDKTGDANKNVYLQSVADHLVTSCGSPSNWGTGVGSPQDFGLAKEESINIYELDIDKVCRLNSLSYPQLSSSAKLNNIALGIKVSQILTITIQQPESQILGANVSYAFPVSTAVNSRASSASLVCYILAQNYQVTFNQTTSDLGLGTVSFQIPQEKADNAMLLMFARASFDERLTSFAVYDFAGQTQRANPDNKILNLTSNNNILTALSNSSGTTIQKSYLFTYSNQQNLTATSSTQFAIPQIVDKSPFVLVACGVNGASYFQDWTAYPQIPLTAGSNFNSSEKNVFTYIVTIKDALYKLEISLGDVAP
jgi:hypothetical protein